MPKKETPDKTPRIFILADTHNQLPEKVLTLAEEASEIWHLGDVCAERIIDELRAVGPPLLVVRGNCDSNTEWPLALDTTRGGVKFRLQHIPPGQPPERVDVLLHGHTHVPRNERRGGVLFLNPGCVARPNQGAPASVAFLEIRDGKVQWQPISLR
jgi:putative phosphoesterase